MRISDPGSGVGEMGSEASSAGTPPAGPPLIGAELFWTAVPIPGEGETETSAGNSGAAFAIDCAGCAFASINGPVASTGCVFGSPGCALGGAMGDDGGAGDGENELRSGASLPPVSEAEVD
jgi:hypothetical protein